MVSVNQTKQQIDLLVRFALEKGLADDQRFSVQRGPSQGLSEVTFDGAENISLALRQLPYTDIYHHLTEVRAYNIKLLDGALVQMMYRYFNNALQSHRLAFFPSPHLDEFQNNPDIYLEEVFYADVIARNIVPIPFRFDYNSQDTLEPARPHPKCHFTLGQYGNCRIPVTAPITPLKFADFVFRNFYNTAFEKYAEDLPKDSGSFEESIRPPERAILHIAIP